MEITKEQLLRAVPNINRQRLDEFVASFSMWSVHFGINTPLRVSHYLAQVLHESACLGSMTENLNYSADRLLAVFPKYFNERNVRDYARNPQKIGNRVYANRMGNGSEGSGDGYRYRGRGLLMLTGRENYVAFNKSDVCTEDVVANPEKVSQYYLNQVSAMWFWERNNINRYCDNNDIVRITRIINGGTNGLSERKALYEKIRKEIK